LHKTLYSVYLDMFYRPCVYIKADGRAMAISPPTYTLSGPGCCFLLIKTQNETRIDVITY
jgi:hypothetical protein